MHALACCCFNYLFIKIIIDTVDCYDVSDYYSLSQASSNIYIGSKAAQSSYFPANQNSIRSSYNMFSNQYASALTQAPMQYYNSVDQHCDGLYDVACQDGNANKYRQLPCRTFIAVGTCPYRDRCVYLHDVSQIACCFFFPSVLITRDYFCSRASFVGMHEQKRERRIVTTPS